MVLLGLLGCAVDPDQSICLLTPVNLFGGIGAVDIDGGPNPV